MNRLTSEGNTIRALDRPTEAALGACPRRVQQDRAARVERHFLAVPCKADFAASQPQSRVRSVDYTDWPSMTRPPVFLSGLSFVLLAACADQGAAPGAPAHPAAAPSTAPPLPAAVDGWREYPLRNGVIAIQPAKWRTDTVDIAVPAGKGLEYKLTMKKGETLVYNISYGTLAEPGTDGQRVPRPH